MNIPIYRAKKIDGEEWVEGYYKFGSYKNILGIQEKHFIIVSYTPDNDACWGGSELLYKIDPSTLAIHFPSMIDKNGKKIFASLSEDGVGGDITKYINLKGTHDGVFKISQHFTLGVHIEFGNDTYVNIERGEWKTFEVVGIHKGDNK